MPADTVFLSGDDAYAWPIAVTISSAARATERPLRFIVADAGFTAASRATIQRAATSVEIIEIDQDLVDGLTTGTFPRAMMAMLAMEHLVPADCGRVLATDGDVLVRTSLTPLLDLDLEGTTLGAAPITGIDRGANPPTVGAVGRVGWDWAETSYAETVWAKFGVPPATLQFNTGVLVIDLQRWRERRVLERALEIAREVDTNDQVHLNLALWNDWSPLDTRWNCKRDDAFILHFAGPRKPWRDDYFVNSFRIEYRDAARAIGWDLPIDRWDRVHASWRRKVREQVPPSLVRVLRER